MSYIDNNLLPNERIVFRTRKSPVVFMVPVIFLLLAFIFAIDNPLTYQINSHINQIFSNVAMFRNIHRIPTLFFLILAVYSAFMPFLIFVTSDFAVTNQRVIMREGFFDRRVTDTRLSTISHVSVDQGPLGQLFNYGDIMINNFGGSGDSFTLIAAPNEFQKSVRALLSPPANPQ